MWNFVTCCLVAEKILLEGINGFLNVLQMVSTFACAFAVQLYRILTAKIYSWKMDTYAYKVKVFRVKTIIKNTVICTNFLDCSLALDSGTFVHILPYQHLGPWNGVCGMIWMGYWSFNTRDFNIWQSDNSLCYWICMPWIPWNLLLP